MNTGEIGQQLILAIIVGLSIVISVLGVIALFQGKLDNPHHPHRSELNPEDLSES